MLLNNSSAFGLTIQDNLTVFVNLDKSLLGETEPYVISAVRHLCGMLLPDDDYEQINLDDYYEIAQRYFKSIKEKDRTGQQLRIFLSYLSGFFHEIRHSHDLLATTYGQDFLYVKLNCYQNIPIVLSSLEEWQLKHPNKRIPIPLKDSLGNFKDLPAEVYSLLNHYIKMNDKIKELNKPTTNIYSNFSTTHLFEAIAINVQLDFVHDIFGDEGVLILTDLIRKSKKASLYLRIRNEFMNYFMSKGIYKYGLGTVINYILWCSIVGSTFPRREFSERPHPVVLFKGLSEHIRSNTETWDISKIKKLCNDYLCKWGLLTTEEVIDRYKTELHNRLNKLERMYQQLGVNNNTIIEGYRSFVKAYEMIQSIINIEPDAYFGQRRYVWSAMRGIMPSISYKMKSNNQTNDFMSHGIKLIEYENWNTLTFYSAVLKLLTFGRSSFNNTFYEDIVFNTLIKNNKGKGLLFSDSSKLFSW